MSRCSIGRLRARALEHVAPCLHRLADSTVAREAHAGAGVGAPAQTPRAGSASARRLPDGVGTNTSFAEGLQILYILPFDYV